MNPNQYKQLKILIKNAPELETESDNLLFLKYDKSGEIATILLKIYREEIKREVSRNIKLSDDEMEGCYFKGLSTLCRSISKDKFQYIGEKSVKNYLYKACNGAATRFIKQKKEHNSFYSIEDFLEFHVYDDEPEREGNIRK